MKRLSLHSSIGEEGHAEMSERNMEDVSKRAVV
jgi:hypothetical protein